MRLISDREARMHDARLTELAGRVSALEAQNAALLATVLSLKSTGAALPVTPRAPDRVLEVIGDVAGPNGPLRALLGKYARQERAKGSKDDEIIATLMHWPDADEEAAA